jgi:hypothetical protein
VTSRERRTKLIQDWYRRFLGRPAGPADLSFWLTVFGAGRSAEFVESEIAGSLEAYGRQGQDPARWLNTAYRWLLGRDRGPAENSLLNLLRLGTSRSQVVLILLSGSEYRVNLITGAYRTYLGRSPGAREVALWLDRLQRLLVSPEQFLTSVLVSEERLRRSGNTNGGWVEGLYADVLGRGPDAVGLQHFMQRLQQGYAVARRNVAAVLLQSDEYFARQVRSYYVSYLGRLPLPSEVLVWVAPLRQGATQEDVIAGILASPAYFNRTGGTNQTWVDQVFTDLFHRVHGTEANTFVQLLDAGTPRAQVASLLLTVGEWRGGIIRNAFTGWLRREPSDGEMAGNLAAFQRGSRDEAILVGLLASTEYLQIGRSFP